MQTFPSCCRQLKQNKPQTASREGTSVSCDLHRCKNQPIGLKCAGTSVWFNKLRSVGSGGHTDAGGEDVSAQPAEGM